MRASVVRFFEGIWMVFWKKANPIYTLFKFTAMWLILNCQCGNKLWCESEWELSLPKLFFKLNWEHVLLSYLTKAIFCRLFERKNASKRSRFCFLYNFWQTASKFLFRATASVTSLHPGWNFLLLNEYKVFMLPVGLYKRKQ